MALTIFWPFATLLWKLWPREAPPIPLPDPSRIAVLEPLAVQVSRESFLRLLDGPILILWILASSVLAGLFLMLVVRTRRLRRGWAGEEAGGQKVLFSDDLGPAVVGYIRPEIVLPAWCRELEEQTLGLILDHELEHLRAGDLRLMITAGVLPVLFPWHLPLWWQFKRLRTAVESDCDLRVVRRYPERIRPYMELLLQVGGREPRLAALVAMLSEPEETLERRIRIMTMPFPKKPWLRAAFLTAVGGILVAVACWAPTPSEAPEEATDALAIELPPELEIPSASRSAPTVVIPPTPVEILKGEGSASQQAGDMAGAPTFTPFTVRPDIKNRSEVSRALEREYPPLLKDAGIGGTVQVWFFIDASGEVQRLMVKESSGHKALDEAALRVGGTLAFTPAMNRDEAVPVWISLPITFASDGQAKEAPDQAKETPLDALKHFVAVTAQYLRDWIDGILHGDGTAEKTETAVETAPAAPSADAAYPAAGIAAAPTFTPYTVRPDIKNRSDVARALEREYPPLLKDAGIGGTIQVWFFIDETGRVRRIQVNESSGHKALDEAALRVAGAIEFTPAFNKTEAVPVWISLPITFTTRGSSSGENSSATTKPEGPAPPGEVADRNIEAAPTFTPYTVRPDIRNRAEVAKALEEAYPPLLRDAGIGGTAQVWFFIDQTGAVKKTQLNESTGHQALDEAALEVARAIRFTAALNQDQPVPVWISLPITFSVR